MNVAIVNEAAQVIAVIVMDSLDTPEAKEFLALAYPGKYTPIEVTEETGPVSPTPNSLWDGSKFIRVGVSPEGILDNDFRYDWDISLQKWVIPEEDPTLQN